MKRITYELAKQLKDAGFPQELEEGQLYWLSDASGVAIAGSNDGFLASHTPAVKDPTLSELIEACGDGFVYLNRVHGGDWVAGTHNTPFEGTLGVSNYESGITPKEAVAKLWLEINKK